ncbi:MAG: D-aminoacyl-tRNA deacylase [Candidatus Saelkia tenebricola]|nr:D-aminoacyl-tRNA deacylase [Candidatus Saelkia tenebricola]
MKAVLQRVKNANVVVNESIICSISHGFLILLGIGCGDNDEDIIWLGNKIINLRVFEDNEGKLNESLLDVKGEVILVSQFTLFADCKKGRRPSFDNAMVPDKAKDMVDKFFQYLKSQNVRVVQGIFKTHMDITLTNYGPVTIILDSKNR